MSLFVFVDNVNTTLSAAVSSIATTISLSSSANLPVLSGGQVMPITLNDAATGTIFIVPTHWSEAGKPFVYQDMLDGVIFAEAMKDASRRLAFLKGELTKERGEVEITIDFKDLDKETHPHPFGSDSVARVVLMHPEGPLADRITDMLKAGHASEIVKMIEDGDLIIKGKGIIHPHAPSSIQIVKANLR